MNKFFADIKKYAYYMGYAARSELKAEVANSYLNWLWWILEPLCFMGIYAFVFKIMFNSSIPHMSAFIFIGITFWEFFNKMLKSSVRLVRNNKPIVSKVYVPKYVLVIEKLLLNLFKTAISFAIVIVLMIVEQVTLSVHLLWAIPIMLSLTLFTFGVCCIFLHFGVYVDDLANITNIFLRLLFYATGVFYNLADKVTGIWGVILIRANPLALYITSLRDCLLYASCPDLLWLAIWTVLGALFTILGIRLIQKNENSYVKVM